MTEKKEPCPTCKGEKVIAGVCECSSEWHGIKVGEEGQDCQCTPEEKCPTCNGSGYAD